MMSKKEIIDYVNKYYFYHRSNDKNITKFILINYIETVSGQKIKAFGVYFNLEKDLYKHKGKYLYSAALSIKNPFITTDQIYSAIITEDKKKKLIASKFDSVVLIRNDKIAEIVVFNNSQISIESIN
jgi:hypothetical protein